MFYQKLENLALLLNSKREAIEKIDKFLAETNQYAGKHIRASFIANKLLINPKITREILTICVDLGILKQKYRYYCPETGAGIEDFEEGQDIPGEIDCDECDDTHFLNREDLIVIYDLIKPVNGMDCKKKSSNPSSISNKILTYENNDDNDDRIATYINDEFIKNKTHKSFSHCTFIQINNYGDNYKDIGQINKSGTEIRAQNIGI